MSPASGSQPRHSPLGILVRRPGHHRHGDSEADDWQAAPRHLCVLRRRRHVGRHRGVREARAAGRARHRRRGRRCCRDDRLAAQGPAAGIGPRRPVCRRRGGAEGGLRDVPHLQRAGRRDGDGVDRRDLLGDQGLLYGHPLHP
eukprot:scaffold1693_cov109-Isochrysis_galbana.AAC.5